MFMLAEGIAHPERAVESAVRLKNLHIDTT